LPLPANEAGGAQAGCEALSENAEAEVMSESKKPNGGHAFPTQGFGDGMSLRDWFAGILAALPRLLLVAG
jgi:hypothetical protein